MKKFWQFKKVRLSGRNTDVETEDKSAYSLTKAFSLGGCTYRKSIKYHNVCVEALTRKVTDK